MQNSVRCDNRCGSSRGGRTPAIGEAGRGRPKFQALCNPHRLKSMQSLTTKRLESNMHRLLTTKNEFFALSSHLLNTFDFFLLSFSQLLTSFRPSLSLLGYGSTCSSSSSLIRTVLPVSKLPLSCHVPPLNSNEI